MLELIIFAFLGSPVFADNTSSISLSPSEVENEWKNTKLSLTAGMSLRSIQDEFNNANMVRVDVGFLASTDFTPWLSGRMGLKFVGLAGSTIAITDEFRPKSAFAFDETYLKIAPNEMASLKLGFVEVRTSTSADIFQAKDHPGVLAALSSGTTGVVVEAQAFSVIPTSTLVTPRYFPEDGNPSLSGASLIGGLYQDRGLIGEIRLSRLNFNSLTPSIAQDSRLAGNEIVGLGGSSARFLYDFNTDEVNGLIGYKWKRVGISFEGTQAQNRKAPSDLGTGVHGEAALKYAFDKFQVRASYGEFNVGSEVYPGSIAGDLFSYNNRQGKQVSLGILNSQETMGVRAAYHTYNEIIDQPFLADREYVGLRFFAKKDLFSGSFLGSRQ